MKKRVIAIFSGNRAEYGLLNPILTAIKKHPNLDYKLIVSGAHLDKSFGNTINEIKNDGFLIHGKVNIKKLKNDQTFTSNSIGDVIIKLVPILKKIKPDVFMVYADRYEGFAAIIASTQMNIPTAHVEGGDITEGGALDDSVRHAMTKLAHIHYTTNDNATNRILAMGEEKWRVKTVGFPAIDMISKGNFASAKELIKIYNLDIKKPIILFTQHSITTEYEKSSKQLIVSLKALTNLAKKGFQVILTYPNNDAGGTLIKEKILELEKKKLFNIQVFKSIGRYNYHGFLALAKSKRIQVVCAGNSSSGIKETPYFGCPTVNIGSRQKGRLRGENVIDVSYKKNEIIKAINKCVYDKKFIKKCNLTNNPYGGGSSGKSIAVHLSNINLNKEKILRKRMTIQGLRSNGWYK